MEPEFVTLVPPQSFIRFEPRRWPLPNGGNTPPPPPGLVPLVNRYVSSSPDDLAEFLGVLVLKSDCELVLDDADLHSAHVALRHVNGFLVLYY